MNLFFDNLINKFAKIKYSLIAVNFLLVFFLILLKNIGVLPMQLGDFIFFSLIYLIFALYRPGWSFLFFIGTIALENINLAPESLGIFVRPYQMIGALTIFSLLLRYFTKRLNFELVRLKWFDYLVGIFVLAGFLSSVFSINKGMAFKQSIIIASFVGLYWLVRNYIQSLDDLKRIVPFFISSGIIIVFYGIWQNIRFLNGFSSFEVMPGRPNSTFTEADWLGIFLVLLIAVIYSIIFKYQVSSIKYQCDKCKKYIIPVLYLLLMFVYTLLILTVSRSAWLGAGFVTLVFLKATLTNFSFRPRDWNGKKFSKQLAYVIGAILLSFGIVYVFHLTNFQLFNRAQSTGTGLQKITIACNGETSMPDQINNIEELKNYNCQHINLEDIQKEKEMGFEIREIYRNDPNVNIRKEIYQKSIAEIKTHPILGIGWGNIISILGKDERGSGLNSSNIFLEVWLGSGILGLLAFLTIWVYIFIKSVVYCIHPHTKKDSIDNLNLQANNFGVGVKDDFESKIIGTFIVLSLFALLIPNLFNAGSYLGILWIWLSLIGILQKK